MAKSFPFSLVSFLQTFIRKPLVKRLQRAGVLHEVDGGGGAHGSEAFEQAEDEEDEGFVVG